MSNPTPELLGRMLARVQSWPLSERVVFGDLLGLWLRLPRVNESGEERAKRVNDAMVSWENQVANPTWLVDRQDKPEDDPPPAPVPAPEPPDTPPLITETDAWGFYAEKTVPPADPPPLLSAEELASLRRLLAGAESGSPKKPEPPHPLALTASLRNDMDKHMMILAQYLDDSCYPLKVVEDVLEVKRRLHQNFEDLAKIIKERKDRF